MSPPPVQLTYPFEGLDEHVLAFGPQDAPRRILIIPPLFDEMNRTRAVLVGAMRELAQHGVMTLLPDLPGCNESGAAIEKQALQGWRSAMTACAREQEATHVASVRGGVLIDGDIALPHWRLAPVKGASLLKTLLRTRIAADKEAGRTSSAEGLIAEAANNGCTELSGYRLGAAMLHELDAAIADERTISRTMQLGTGEGELWGKPVWLRAEPQEDADMSAALAAEWLEWSAA